MPTKLDTTAQPPTEGRLIELAEDMLTLGIAGTDYKLNLVHEIDLPEGTTVGRKVTGTLHAMARRVDVITAGGCYIEPVFGRPRRVQGRIVGGHPASRSIYVRPVTGVTLICTLTDNRQQTEDFTLGQLVSFDVEPGTVFKPVVSGS
jgi:hypothetical protein